MTGIDTVLGYHVARDLASSGFNLNVLLPEELVPEDMGATPWRTFTGQTTDVETCLQAMEGASAVFHFESGRLVGAGPISVRSFLEGTRNLLVAMARSGVENLVFSSSALVFRPGDLSEPGDEGSPSPGAVPDLACLEALRAAGELVARYCDSGKVRGVTVNPTLVMGNHDLPGGAGWSVIERILNQDLPEARGTLNVVRAEDAAGAAVRALGRGRPGRSYILAGENLSGETLKDLVVKARGGRGEAGGTPAAGRLRSVARRLVPRVRAPESPLVGLAGEDLCYSPARAVEELALEITPVVDTVGTAVDWYLSRAG